MMMSTRLGIPTTYLELGRLHLASGRVEHVMCHVDLDLHVDLRVRTRTVAK